jgi:hypothetical protein
MHVRRILCILVLTLLSATALFAQQTGAISGKVTADGAGLPGVTVEARSAVLPQPRVTTTDATGEFRLPALQPGTYNLTFSLAGMQNMSRRVEVVLGQTTPTNVNMSVAAVAESITVTAETTMVDPTTTEIKSAVPQSVIQQVPVGQEYRDLLKLAPAVQVNDGAEVRGPAAGGSEQDNVYQFDGVNVTLPLFGTLAAEPSSHDIAQISVLRGGAKAVDFNRSAGMTVDSVSRSGTAQWKGELKYQYQGDSLTADLVSGASSRYDETRSWGSANLGGPVLHDRLFLYGSYYRPTRNRDNVSNLYGNVPDFDSSRGEYFLKLTGTPTNKILLNLSYRDSDRTNENSSIGNAEAVSVSVGEESQQQIGIAEASWVINSRSFATFKYNDYGLKTSGRPDNVLDVVPSASIGAQLDIANLDRMGYFTVPCPNNRPANSPCVFSAVTGASAYNDFIRPFVDKYGYLRGGERAGGGAVGGYVQINDQDFYRDSWQVGYDFTLGSRITHDVHVGYMTEELREDLARFSNGWGSITIPQNATCPTGTQCAGQPFFFQATFTRSTEGTLGGQVINSWFESQNFEVNDTIKWGNWAFNVGVLLSNDEMFGEGLAEADNEAGFEGAPGTRYKMHEIEWSKQIQPRLGATWAYNGDDTVYASYARYNPAASSLPRAASWDRNTLGLTQEVFFDAAGRVIGSRQLAASSGKLFADDLDPRYTDEYLIGTSQQLSPGWTARLSSRYRYSTNFWEDTNNNARTAFKAPADIAEKGLYIPNLGSTNPCTGLRCAIGSGSSYVIAELDGAFTKYYEVTLESDYSRGNAWLRGTYTWSHYYGNFDQDNTSTTYDFATFIGSSNIADGGGRQMWDNKYGNLHADRRHLLKLYGYYNLPWNATMGAFTLYQSGHAWEMWSWEPYGPSGTNVIGSNRSDTNRYAEPAGRRTTPGHYQLDLNYTQNFAISGLNLQLIADLYNVFDKQTGYSPQPAVHLATFGQPRLFHAPRRLQIAARIQF